MSATGTWSYSGDPAASTKDAVRYLVGDTNKDAKQLSDQEISYAISQYPNQYAAAALSAEALSALYARYMDKTVGPIHVSYSQRKKQYDDLADTLWIKAGGKNMGVRALDLWSGSESVTEKREHQLDTELIQPFFRRNMFHPVDQPIQDLHPLEEQDVLQGL